MPEPIEYRIVRDLQAALQAMHIAAGYFYSLPAVGVKFDPNVDVELLTDVSQGVRPFALIQVAPETWAYSPASQLKLRMPVTVHWLHDAHPAEDVAIGEPMPPSDEDRIQLFFRGCADVERAVAVDISRGGLATDTRIVKRTMNPEIDSQLVHAMVDLEILLHRTYGQPTGA